MTHTSTTRYAVNTHSAPAAVGPYSQAVSAGPYLFISGQLPIDPATGSFPQGGAAVQAAQSIRNIEAILRAVGGSLSDVVKTTVLLADLAAFTAVNAVYGGMFSGQPKPARAAYEVAALPLGALVEIEAVAFLPDAGGR
ncbi:Rid family detoxifying hydrolase [Streptomyces malaysiensis]|uniref:Rid family detoxifying hydrolase n=1 Tax=Streptomyces malaysiensis TaxID=92644 RepID=UPI00142EB348|nr:Rid family detoxifying hydrolase [Streptomyces malaysiensis]